MTRKQTLQCRECNCQKDQITPGVTRRENIGDRDTLCRFCERVTTHRVLVSEDLLDLADPWPHKKHKGKLVRTVIREDLHYVRFFIEEAERPVRLSPQALLVYKQQLNQRRHYS